MTSARFLVGDVFDRLATLPDQSVDLVCTSPPFLALRSYLPDGHPDKPKEIGSEPTPAMFLDTLLALTAEWGRVTTRHGSICVELGDTYSNGVEGWPAAKSLAGIPTLYAWSLAYGRNLLTGEPSPAGRWIVRNLVAWVRPNPPVGALCVDDQTEALTPDGWKRHDELADGDLIAAYDPRSDSCRFLPAKFVRYDREAEPMVVIDKRSTSQVLTEDHRVWTRTRKSHPHVRLARDLTNDCDTLLCARFDDIAGPAPVTTTRAALLGWFIAEGSPHHRQARIVQSQTANPAKVDRIRRLLDADGSDYREATYLHPGGTTIVTFNVKGELAEWLNLHHKRLPMQYVTTWPEAQAQALFDALIDGDGHRRKNADGLLFHQQDERVVDSMQVLALRLGYRATKSYQSPMRIWQLTMSRDTPTRSVRWTRVRKWDGEGIRREAYTGTVWCPMVETSFWLARRDGKTFITGNSDKFRPATSYITIATRAPDRWFDLDAVRTPYGAGTIAKNRRAITEGRVTVDRKGADRRDEVQGMSTWALTQAGAPPLDWWEVVAKGYDGSHYAVWPTSLLETPIEAMCPRRVCRTCGEPSRRITERIDRPAVNRAEIMHSKRARPDGSSWREDDLIVTDAVTIGWSTCGCPGTDGIRLDGYHTGDGWRPGHVLDPFGGSGTTGVVASGRGRDCTLIDIDERNAGLARERLGMFLEVDYGDTVTAA